MIEFDETIRDYGYVNFKPAKEEEWSVYKLEDGTIIKLKVTPLKFLKKDDKILINPMVLMVPFAPEERRGERSFAPPPATPNELINQVDAEDLKFEVIQEPWNEYELDGGVQYFTKIVAVIISRTKLFDTEGEPIYLVNHQLLTKRHPLV